MKRFVAILNNSQPAPGLILTFVILSLGLVVMHSASAFQVNLLVNGGFESGDFAPWTVGGTMSTPVITDESVYEGAFAARLGNPVEAAEYPAGASWIAQAVHIPRSFQAPELVFQYRIVTNDIIHWASFRAEIHDAQGQWLETLLRDGYDPRNGAAIPGYDMGWQEARFDLSDYRGQTIQLYFESRNEHNGGWGIWTYVDDVRIIDRTQVFLSIIMRNHLGFIPTLTPSPTAEWTPTRTHTPTWQPTLTMTPTMATTLTPTRTWTPTPTLTSTATPTITLTPTPTPGWFAWPSPTIRTIADVALMPDGTGWAVGASGLILRLDQENWKLWAGTPPTTENLTAVHAVSPTQAWAVTEAGSIVEFDGAGWQVIGRVSSEPLALWDVHLTPGGEVGWAVGERGTVVWFDGTNWFLVEENLVPTNQTLRAVYTVSEDEAWAVGDGGTILHYVDNRWFNWSETRPSIQTSATLRDVQMDGAGNGWIVGDLGTLMKYIHGAWYRLVSHPMDVNLYALKLLTPDYGWAVGGRGTLLSFDGERWTQANSPVGATLMGLDLLSPEDGWAVGATGALLRRGFAAQLPAVTPTPRPPTPTWTSTPTSTATPTVTLTPTFATSTPSFSLTPTLTSTATSTPTSTPTGSPLPTATLTAVQTSTATTSPTRTTTVTPTFTWTPTETR